MTVTTPERAPVTPENHIRDFLGALKAEFDRENNPLKRTEWVRERVKTMTQEQLAVLDQKIREGATVPGVILDAQAREIIQKVSAERLAELKKQIQAGNTSGSLLEGWTNADMLKVGVAATGVSIFSWMFFKNIKLLVSSPLTFFKSFIYTTSRDETGRVRRHFNVGRSLINTVVMLGCGTIGAFMSAAYIERFLQKVGLKKLTAATEAAKPLGGVATGAVPTAHNLPQNPSFETIDIDTGKLPEVKSSDTVDQARQIIGTDLPLPNTPAKEKPDVQKDPNARLRELNQKLAESKNKAGTFTLVDAYRLQAELELRNAEKLMTLPDKKNEVLAAQMRATYCESYSNALAKYAELMIRYEDIKNVAASSGVKLDPAELKADTDISAQFQNVVNLAKARLKAGFGKKGDASAMSKTEADLWEALKGPDVKPDGSTDANKGLPMFEASLNLLMRRYEELLKTANGTVSPESHSDQLVVEDMNKRVIAWLMKNDNKDLATMLSAKSSRGFTLKPSKTGGRDTLPGGVWNIAWDVRSDMPELYKGNRSWSEYLWKFGGLWRERADLDLKLSHNGLAELFKKVYSESGEKTNVKPEEAYSVYARHAQSLTDREKGLAEFKHNGKINVGMLTELQQSMGKYQNERFRLSVLRSRDRKGASGGGDVSMWTSTSAELAQQYERFMFAQQEDSTKRMSKHLDEVEKNVLSIGPAEMMEQNWNENGRMFIGNVANLMTDVQTYMIPNFGSIWGMNLDFGKKMKGYLMGDLYVLLGWPKYTEGPNKGEWKEPKDFKPEEKDAMIKKQKSIKTTIEEFLAEGKAERKPGIFERMKETTALMGDMSSEASKEQMQKWMAKDTGPIKDAPQLANVRIKSVSEIPAIAAANGCTKSQVIAHCCEQISVDTDAYFSAYGKMLKGFHDVIGTHGDWEQELNNLAIKQGEILVGWIIAILGTGVVAIYVLSKVPGIIGRVAYGVGAAPLRTTRMLMGRGYFPSTGKPVLNGPVPGGRPTPLPTNRPLPGGTPVEPVRPTPGTNRPVPTPEPVRPRPTTGPAIPERAPGRVPVDPDVERLLARARAERQLSEVAADNIRRSTQAQKIFKGAKDAAEIQKLAKAANRASFTAARGVAGITGAFDVFGVYLAVCAYQELGVKIKNTDNPGLKDVYATMQIKEVRVGAVYATCFIINGLALVVGGTIFAACSIATLPVTLVTLGASYVADELYDAAETWTKSAQDWANTADETEIMRKLEELRPGNASTFWALGLAASSASLQEGYKTAEGCNEGTRMTLVHAYFIHKMSGVSLDMSPELEKKFMELQKADLGPYADLEEKEINTGKNLGSERQRLLLEMLRPLRKEAVSDAVMYMMMRADKKVTGEDLEAAIMHARVRARSRVLKKAEEEEIKKAEAEKREPNLQKEYLAVKGPDGAIVQYDLSQYAGMAIGNRNFHKNQSPEEVINAYRATFSDGSAKFLNTIKKEVPTLNTESGSDLKKMAHERIQGEIIDRLDPFITRLRGKFLEHFKEGIFTGRLDAIVQERMQYALFTLIRHKLAGEVQALLDKNGDASGKDIDAITQTMIKFLSADEGSNLRFDGLEALADKMDLHGMSSGAHNSVLLTSANLHQNIIKDTNTPAFLEFVMAHPTFFAKEQMPKDVNAVLRLTFGVAEEKERYLTRNNFTLPGEADRAFLGSYATFLSTTYAESLEEKKKFMSEEEFGRLVKLNENMIKEINALNDPAYKWHIMPDIFRGAKEDNDAAYQRKLKMIAILPRVKEHALRLESYERLVLSNKGLLHSHNLNTLITPRPDGSITFLSDNNWGVLFAFGGKGKQVRYDREECLKPEGKEVLDESGSPVGRMRCKKVEGQFRDGTPRLQYQWTFEPAKEQVLPINRVTGQVDFPLNAFNNGKPVIANPEKIAELLDGAILTTTLPGGVTVKGALTSEKRGDPGEEVLFWSLKNVQVQEKPGQPFVSADTDPRFSHFNLTGLMKIEVLESFAGGARSAKLFLTPNMHLRALDSANRQPVSYRLEKGSVSMVANKLVG